MEASIPKSFPQNFFTPHPNMAMVAAAEPRFGCTDRVLLPAHHHGSGSALKDTGWSGFGTDKNTRGSIRQDPHR